LSGVAPGGLKFAGAACVVLNAAGVFVAVKVLTMIPVLGWLVGLYLAYAGLALGQLQRECRAVARTWPRAGWRRREPAWPGWSAGT
jgi:adenosylcobinamide-phosphate synthase